METPFESASSGKEFESPDNIRFNGVADWKHAEETWKRLCNQKDSQINTLQDELEKITHQLKEEMAERQRWEQYLHDAITQSLFSAGLIAEVLPRLWDRDQAAARKSLEDLRRLTFGAIGEMRILLAESRPSTLHEAEFGDLLTLLGNVLAGRLNVPVTVKIQTKVKFPEEVQICLYRLSKEILDGIIQRARDRKVSLRLSQQGQATRISILESGDSFERSSSLIMASNTIKTAIHEARALGITVEFNKLSGSDSEIIMCWGICQEKDQK